MIVRALALVFGLGAVLTAPVLAEAPFAFDSTPGKLPKTVVPSAYDIALIPNLKSFTFNGHETVAVRVTTATRAVVVNTKDMTISAASVDGRGAAHIATDANKQITTMTFAAPIAAGSHVLRIAFAGKIGAAPQGLFHQDYSTPQGKRTMLATQMESTDARRMFPSWDEPSFRATYRLTVTVPQSFDAVSNMPATSVSTSGDTKTVTFARTPKMASYLVALCAGEFGYVSGVAPDGVKVRVVAPKGREENGRYALSAAEELLAYYDDYFGVKYPLSKLDLIAVPGGFPGAMENWGAITFDQPTLLWDPKVEPESAKEEVFSTVAHEMAHQWMGDLVTMAWWDNLWLNEGFADWMQTKATDHFNPDWHLWERVNGDVEFAMFSDGNVTSHPIHTPVADETQADAAFDEITYQKGGAFVRMMEEYLGEATFRDGIRRYLKANAYGNTTSANLYASLAAASHHDIAGFAAGWTEKAGFPQIDVTSSCAGGRRTLSLTQQRFLYGAVAPAEQLWVVPIAIQPLASSQAPVITVLRDRTATVPGFACADPVVVNAGAAGFFRVHYDADDFAGLQANLTRLQPVDRVRFLSDTEAFVIAGSMPASAYLNSLAKIGNEDDLAVWESVARGLGQVARSQEGRPGEAAFDAYRRSLLRPAFDRIGWDGGIADPAKLSLEKALIAALGASGDPQTIAESRARFAKFLTDPQTLPPDLRGTVLTVVGEHADEATWEQLRSLLRAAKTSDEQQMYSNALWVARDPALAQKNLAMATNGDIPAEAGPIAALQDVATVATSGRQPKLAWVFFKANAPKLVAPLSAFERAIVIAQFLPVFWNAAPAAELEAFARSSMSPSAAPQLAHALDQVRLFVAVADRLNPEVDGWVATNATTTAKR